MLYKALTKNYILSQDTSLQWHKNYQWSRTQIEQEMRRVRLKMVLLLKNEEFGTG